MLKVKDSCDFVKNHANFGLFVRFTIETSVHHHRLEPEHSVDYFTQPGLRWKRCHLHCWCCLGVWEEVMAANRGGDGEFDISGCCILSLSF